MKNRLRQILLNINHPARKVAVIAVILYVFLLLAFHPYDRLRDTFYVFYWDNTILTLVYTSLLSVLFVFYFLYVLNIVFFQSLVVTILSALELSIYTKINLWLIYLVLGLPLDLLVSLNHGIWVSFFLVVMFTMKYTVGRENLIKSTVNNYAGSLLIAVVIALSVLDRVS